MEKSRPKIIVILGPNASGKTKLAVKLASKFNGEIISADSRQVYRGMDIGTGKDLEEFSIFNFKFSNKSKVQKPKLKEKRLTKMPYHLIDVVSPRTDFNVAKWLKLAKKAIDDILSRGNVPFVVGGTGLYISALVLGYNLAGTKPNLELRKRLEKQRLETLLRRLKKLDPATYRQIDKKNKRRVVRALEVCLANHDEGGQTFSRLREKVDPQYDFLLLGVKRAKKEIIELIDKRTEKQMGQGLIEEVRRLHKQGVSWKRLDNFGLEYRWVSKYLKGELGREEMVEKLKTAIHQFAKRQMTWFRKMNNVRWVKNYQDALKIVKRWLDS